MAPHIITGEKMDLLSAIYNVDRNSEQEVWQLYQVISQLQDQMQKDGKLVVNVTIEKIVAADPESAG